MELNEKVDWLMAVVGRLARPGIQVPYGGAAAPDGWLLCDGSAVSRTTYAALFAVIATAYGSGDGSTTFNVPNKKGKTSVGRDAAQTEFDTVGESGGAKTVTLTTGEIPSHNHGIKSTATADSTGANARDLYSGGSAGFTTENAGGGGGHNNLQPYEVDNWIIKT